ncbi:MAG: YkvA family protein [Armatimonadota bacterium]
MADRPKISPKLVGKMLKDMGGLAVSPEGRKLVSEHLEAAIRRSKLGGVMLDRVGLMHRYFRDPAEPVKPKLLIGAALLYLIIPNDLLPDWLPILGLTDDFTAIAIVWKQLADVLGHYEERSRLRLAAEG